MHARLLVTTKSDLLIQGQRTLGEVQKGSIWAMHCGCPYEYASEKLKPTKVKPLGLKIAPIEHQ
jgi:hypothetical protein